MIGENTPYWSKCSWDWHWKLHLFQNGNLYTHRLILNPKLKLSDYGVWTSLCHPISYIKKQTNKNRIKDTGKFIVYLSFFSVWDIMVIITAERKCSLYNVMMSLTIFTMILRKLSSKRASLNQGKQWSCFTAKFLRYTCACFSYHPWSPLWAAHNEIFIYTCMDIAFVRNIYICILQYQTKIQLYNLFKLCTD